MQVKLLHFFFRKNTSCLKMMLWAKLYQQRTYKIFIKIKGNRSMIMYFKKFETENLDKKSFVIITLDKYTVSQNEI
jgi:hypothetical protein